MFGVAWQTLVCKYFYDFITWYIEAHIIPYGVHKQRLFNILKMFSNKHWLVSWWNFHLVSENVNQIFGLYMITTRKWPDPSSFAGPHPSLWFRLKLYFPIKEGVSAQGLCGTVQFIFDATKQCSCSPPVMQDTQLTHVVLLLVTHIVCTVTHRSI